MPDANVRLDPNDAAIVRRDFPQARLVPDGESWWLCGTVREIAPVLSWLAG